MRVANDAKSEEARAEMINAAFIGWQVVSSQATKKPPSFQKYLKQLGLSHVTNQRFSRQEFDREKVKAQRNVKLALNAFSGGVNKDA